MREFVVGRDAAPHARMTYPLKVATISVPSPRATTRGGHRMMARHGVDSAPPPPHTGYEPPPCHYLESQ